MLHNVTLNCTTVQYLVILLTAAAAAADDAAAAAASVIVHRGPKSNKTPNYCPYLCQV